MAKFFITPSHWRTDEYRDVCTRDEISQYYASWPPGVACRDAEQECDTVEAYDIADACMAAYRLLCEDAERHYGPNWREYGTGLNPDAATAYGTVARMWDERAERQAARESTIDAALDE